MPAKALLAGVVRVIWPGGLNSRLYLDVNSFARHTPWAHSFMHDYALWLGLVLLAATFLVAYAIGWWRRDAHAAGLLFLGGAGTLVGLGLNQIVGHAAKELRPYGTYTHALVLVGKANDYAFPSDHATVAGALLMSVVLVIRRAPSESWGAGTYPGIDSAERRGFTGAMVALAAIASVLALFLCFARVYAGAHYPGDVVAGLLLGAVVALVVSAARPLAYALAASLERTSLAVLVRRPSPPGSRSSTRGRRRALP